MAEKIKFKGKKGYKRANSMPRGLKYEETGSRSVVEGVSASFLGRSLSEDNLASWLLVRHAVELAKKESKILSPELREYLITEYIVEIDYDDSDGHMKKSLMKILPEDVDEDTIFDIAPGLYKGFLDEEWRKMAELVRQDELREDRESAQRHRNRAYRS